MKQATLLLLLAVGAGSVFAQTTAKPATPAAKKPVAIAAKSAIAKPAAAKPCTPEKLLAAPANIPVVKGEQQTAFALHYIDIKVGDGPDAEPGKLYSVHYTGWIAEDGRKFDSSYDHPGVPVQDKDGKPVLGEDGKPKVGDPQPITFPQGMGRVIPGWDQGFEGMKIGGKRRLFIPYQLAYGVRGRQTGDPKNPGIPPKAGLIFDVELVKVSDMQMPPSRPGMPGAPGMPGHPMPPGMNMKPPTPAAAPGTPASPAKPVTPAAAPAAPATPAAPAAPASTTTPTAPKAPQS